METIRKIKKIEMSIDEYQFVNRYKEIFKLFPIDWDSEDKYETLTDCWARKECPILHDMVVNDTFFQHITGSCRNITYNRHEQKLSLDFGKEGSFCFAYHWLSTLVFTERTNIKVEYK